jgi:hypothetical protein
LGTTTVLSQLSLSKRTREIEDFDSELKNEGGDYRETLQVSTRKKKPLEARVLLSEEKAV